MYYGGMLDLTGHAQYILDRIDNVGDHWFWKLSRTDGGYAQAVMTINGKRRKVFVHVLSHETFLGPVPAGYDVDHLCRIRHCVRPGCLEAVTPEVNQRRAHYAKWGLPWEATKPGDIALSTHCVRGHLREGNTSPSGLCRLCNKDACRRYQERQRALALAGGNL